MGVYCPSAGQHPVGTRPPLPPELLSLLWAYMVQSLGRRGPKYAHESRVSSSGPRAGRSVGGNGLQFGHELSGSFLGILTSTGRRDSFSS